MMSPFQAKMTMQTIMRCCQDWLDISYSFEEVNLDLNVITIKLETEKIGGSQSCETAANDSNLDDSGHPLSTLRTKLAAAWIRSTQTTYNWRNIQRKGRAVCSQRKGESTEMPSAIAL